MRSQTQGKTIVLPLASPHSYHQLVESTVLFRAWVVSSFQRFPSLFPLGFTGHFQLCGGYTSKKQQVVIRRIRLPHTRETYQIRPSSLMPYMVGRTEELEKPLLLRMWGVPFQGIAYCFGRDAMYWYRCFRSVGRFHLVGTTVKTQAALPRHLIVDEKHTRWYGEKNYIATVVSGGCFLGASIEESASAEALTKGYQAFAQELKQTAPTFQPTTATTDGWEATSAAMRALFGGITVVLCFLHSWLSIRDRCRRDHRQRKELGERVWDAYKAATQAVFSQKLRRLREWAEARLPESPLKSKVIRLCERRKQFTPAYQHPKAPRTSNAVDRLMDFQDRQLYAMRGLKGNEEATLLLLRASCLLWNFHPYTRHTKEDKSARSPFEQRNGFVYEEGWLRNLLCAASLKGQRPLHKIR